MFIADPSVCVCVCAGWLADLKARGGTWLPWWLCGPTALWAYWVRRKWVPWDFWVDWRWLSEWDLTVLSWDSTLTHRQAFIDDGAISFVSTQLLFPQSRKHIRCCTTVAQAVAGSLFFWWLHKRKCVIFSPDVDFVSLLQQAGNEKQIFKMCRFTKSYQRWMFAYRKSRSNTFPLLHNGKPFPSKHGFRNI